MTHPNTVHIRCRPVVPVRSLVEWAGWPASTEPPVWLRLPSGEVPSAKHAALTLRLRRRCGELTRPALLPSGEGRR
jgi:hypothetical protein